MAHEMQEGWQLERSQGRQQRARSLSRVAQVWHCTAAGPQMLPIGSAYSISYI